jgi:hypothetical protein
MAARPAMRGLELISFTRTDKPACVLHDDEDEEGKTGRFTFVYGPRPTHGRRESGAAPFACLRASRKPSVMDDEPDLAIVRGPRCLGSRVAVAAR